MDFRRLQKSARLIALSVALTSAFSVVALADTWGAISIDLGKFEHSPFYGVGGGESEVEAQGNAQKFCQEAGGKNCKVVATYTRCGAYAASAGDGAYGIAPTKKEAEALALKDCKGGCKLVIADCN